jgi:hypothetical protein
MLVLVVKALASRTIGVPLPAEDKPNEAIIAVSSNAYVHCGIANKTEVLTG